MKSASFAKVIVERFIKEQERFNKDKISWQICRMDLVLAEGKSLKNSLISDIQNSKPRFPSEEEAERQRNQAYEREQSARRRRALANTKSITKSTKSIAKSIIIEIKPKISGEARQNQPPVTLEEAQEQAKRVMEAAIHGGKANSKANSKTNSKTNSKANSKTNSKAGDFKEEILVEDAVSDILKEIDKRKKK